MSRVPGRSSGALVALAALLCAGAPAAGQQTDLTKQIADSQKRLEEIRDERSQLQTELNNLRSRARDVASELQNIERQISASRAVVAEIDFQLDATSARITEIDTQLRRTRNDLQSRSARLSARLREIVKRGPLNNVRVLLGAESFSDLLNRYRYLQLFASLDRLLFDNVQALETSLVLQNQEMASHVSDLGRLRQSKLDETQEFELVRSTRQNALQSFRVREQQAAGRLDELESNMMRMTSLVSRLEQQRRSDEQRDRVAGAPAPGPSSISTADAGSLDWPVDGTVVYEFGRSVQPNGTVLRWNGIGIAAGAGTPVRAVRPGLVVLAGQFEGYGPTVVLSHGDGFYTLYLYLEDLSVVEGRSVAKGQVVGTVGGSHTPEGPHIEFQVRAPIGNGSPEAQDPTIWLKPRAGT